MSEPGMDAFEKLDKDFAYGANESLTTTLRAIRKDAFLAGRRAGLGEAEAIARKITQQLVGAEWMGAAAVSDAILAAKGE